MTIQPEHGLIYSTLKQMYASMVFVRLIRLMILPSSGLMRLQRQPPPSVYVKLIDRQFGLFYTSNIVTIAKPEPAPEPAPLPSPTLRKDVTTPPTGYTEQESYSGDCYERPSGSTCLGYSDGYKWLIYDTVLGWEGFAIVTMFDV